jgi:hypothetical protein
VGSIAERIAGHLTPVLGSFNARIWVQTVADKSCGLAPAEIEAQHVPAIANGLRTALATFVGRAGADQLVERIQREVV